MVQVIDMQFLTEGDVDVLRSAGVEISTSPDNQRMTIWRERDHHGSIYVWNNLIEQWQRAAPAFRSHLPRAGA